MIRGTMLFVAQIVIISLVTLCGCASQKSQDTSTEPVGGNEASGTFSPAGPPVEQPVRVDAGKSCIVDIKQSYTISGTLSGALEIDYRILINGPRGSPPGTTAEEWIAHGTIPSKIDEPAA